jgi:hypothetical protein
MPTALMVEYHKSVNRHALYRLQAGWVHYAFENATFDEATGSTQTKCAAQ